MLAWVLLLVQGNLTLVRQLCPRQDSLGNRHSRQWSLRAQYR